VRNLELWFLLAKSFFHYTNIFYSTYYMQILSYTTTSSLVSFPDIGTRSHPMLRSNISYYVIGACVHSPLFKFIALKKHK